MPRRRDLARYLAGFVVPYVVVVSIYALSGHIHEFMYYYQRYGRDIFMAPLTREFMRDKIREQIDKYFLGIAAVALAAALLLWLLMPETRPSNTDQQR